MADLTAIVLTKNEEKNLFDCLKSIQNITKRIVVIDSGSEDLTLEIARKFTTDIYVHPFINYAKQFNWGIDNTNINTKWIMRIDADERLTPALCNELENIMKKHADDDVNGITMEADLYFMRKHIKYGGRKKRKLMLFKTGIGRIEDREMDEHTILTKGTSVNTKEKFLHYDFKDLDSFINKLNWYASREMKDYFDFTNSKISLSDKKIQKTRSKKFGFYYKLPMFWRSWYLFIYFYIFRLGFLDGKEGFIYHYMYQRWYRCLVDAKIYERILMLNNRGN